MHVVQSDNELVKCYINGDENALAVLLNKHQRKIFSYILVRVKDRYLAEDIFQDTFCKVIDSLRAASAVRTEHRHERARTTSPPRTRWPGRPGPVPSCRRQLVCGAAAGADRLHRGARQEPDV